MVRKSASIWNRARLVNSETEGLEKLIMIGSSPRSFRDQAARYGLAIVSVGAGLTVYIRTEFVPDRLKEAGLLLLLAEIALVAGMVLGIIGLPRLEGFVALFIFTIAGIFVAGLVY